MPNRSWKRPGTLAHAKRQALISALYATNNNLSAAAIRLEIGRTTLYRLLEKYKIEIGEMAQSHFHEQVVGLTIATRSSGSVSGSVIHSPTRLEIRDGKLVLVGITEQSGSRDGDGND